MGGVVRGGSVVRCQAGGWAGRVAAGDRAGRRRVGRLGRGPGGQAVIGRAGRGRAGPVRADSDNGRSWAGSVVPCGYRCTRGAGCSQMARGGVPQSGGRWASRLAGGSK